MTCYVVVKKIWDVNYNFFRLSVFKCDWVDNSVMKTDDLSFTYINYKKKLDTNQTQSLWLHNGGKYFMMKINLLLFDLLF